MKGGNLITLLFILLQSTAFLFVDYILISFEVVVLDDFNP